MCTINIHAVRYNLKEYGSANKDVIAIYDTETKKATQRVEYFSEGDTKMDNKTGEGIISYDAKLIGCAFPEEGKPSQWFQTPNAYYIDENNRKCLVDLMNRTEQVLHGYNPKA